MHDDVAEAVNDETATNRLGWCEIARIEATRWPFDSSRRLRVGIPSSTSGLRKYMTRKERDAVALYHDSKRSTFDECPQPLRSACGVRCRPAHPRELHGVCDGVALVEEEVTRGVWQLVRRESVLRHSEVRIRERVGATPRSDVRERGIADGDRGVQWHVGKELVICSATCAIFR